MIQKSKSFSDSAEKILNYQYAKNNYILVAYIAHKTKSGKVVSLVTTQIGRAASRYEANKMKDDIKYMTIQKVVDHRNGYPVMEDIMVRRHPVTFWNGKEDIFEHIIKIEIVTKSEYLSNIHD